MHNLRQLDTQSNTQMANAEVIFFFNCVSCEFFFLAEKNNVKYFF